MIAVPFEVAALVCDLDGVVYRGDSPIPGAIDALARLASESVPVLFCTNNSRPTIEQYLSKLASLGVDADADEILTSAVVTGEEVRRRGLSGGRAIVVGGPGIREALGHAGVEVDLDPGVRSADLVVVGIDPAFDYDAMARAAFAVRDGAVFIATNDDATFPAPDGLWPGAGAVLASIERASGRRAEVMGKPHPPMMDAAARRLGNVGPVAVVGDRPETDLDGGRARGWKTILVLSGVTSEDQARALSPAPDAILPDLGALLDDR